jgi:hypothetical protein
MVLNPGTRPVGAVETALGVFRMTEISTSFTKGGTLPTIDVQDGDRHYWVGAGVEEWFYYDDGRSAWLSDRVIEYKFGNIAGEAAGYVTKWMGRASSATVGFIPDADMVLTGVEAVQNYFHATQAFTLWIDGVSNAGSQLALLSLYDGEDFTLNEAIASGEVLACKATRVSSAEHLVTYTLRRTVS